MKKIIKSLLTIILLIVCMLTVLIGINFLNTRYNANSEENGKYLAKDSVVYALGYKPVVIVSGSMLPVIQINSINIVKQCDIEDVKIGDIIMYVRDYDGLYITHRIIDIEGEGDYKYLIVKGDANQYADPDKITQDNLSGKIIYTCNWIAPIVTKIMPNDGNIDVWTIAKLCVIILLILLVVFTIIQKLIEYIVIFIITLRKDRPDKRNYREIYNDMLQEEQLDLKKIQTYLTEEENEFNTRKFGTRFMYNLYYNRMINNVKEEKNVLEGIRYYTRKIYQTIEKENKK